MRFSSILSAVFLSAVATCASAQSRPYDPQALARYDASYVQCEATFPDMAGHRDEAYLSLWRAPLGPKTSARLADARATPTYKAESRRLRSENVKAAAPSASSALSRQCRGLWGEYGRAPRGKS